MRNEADGPFDGPTRKPDGDVLLAGRYRVVRELGSGGMGTVYLARDEMLGGREFAVKMPPAVLTRNRKAVEHLRAEAQRGMDLAHPNIVTLRGFEERSDGVFLVLDYIAGKTLEELLHERKTLSENEVLTLFTPLAAALDYAHREKVVHRDVKPSNILIRESDGKPFLADFGIAREMKESLTRLTGQSTSGTLPYMSPEQLSGDAPLATQDVYSFAATMYECLAGHPPFFRGEIADQIKTKPPDPLPGPPSQLKESILRGLGKDRSTRPRSCAALLRGEAAPAEEAKTGKGSKTLHAVLAVLLLLAAVAGAMLATRNGGEPVRDPPVPSAKTPKPRLLVPEEPDPPPAPTFAGRLEVTFPAAAETYTQDGVLVVTGTLSDCPGGWVLVNGERYLPTVDGSFKVRLPLSEGESRIEVSAIDGAETAHEPKVYRVIHDLTPPGIEIDAPVEGALLDGSELTVSGRASDPCLVEVKVAGAAVTLAADGGFATGLKLGEGPTRITVEATDRAGNRSEASRGVTCDTTPPELEVLAPADGHLTKEVELPVSGTVADATLERLTVTGGPVRVADGKFGANVRLLEGRNEIEVVAVDRVGHSTTKIRTVTLDTTKPTLDLDPLPETMKTSTIRVSGTVSEEGCTVTVCDREAPVSNGRFEQTVSLAKDGRFDIEVTATDRAGNSTKVSRTVVRKTAPDGYTYRPETLAAFQNLVSGSEWSQGNPLRTGTGTKGMLRATHRRTGLNFVVVPAGQFQRGSTDGGSDEQPVCTVTFIRAFLLSETECTQAAWKAVMGSNPSNFIGDDRRPVEQVSWEDLTGWLQRAGGGLRLPSEAEWEYACRSGSTGKWCFGDDEGQLGKYAVHSANSGSQTKPVGGMWPNSWGLHDMHGNVWEWCEDWYGSYGDRETPTDGSARTTKGGSAIRVSRGGSWFDSASSCRSAHRDWYSPGSRNLDLGFRPARSLP